MPDERVDIGDLYRRYGALVRALYRSRLGDQEVEDAVAETFATMQDRKDAFEGGSDRAVRIWFSHELFRCFKATLETARWRERPADAILIQEVLWDGDASVPEASIYSREDEDWDREPPWEPWGIYLCDDDDYWWDILAVETDSVRDLAVLSEDRAHDRIYLPIVPKAVRADSEVLVAYLETMARGQASELAPSELLAPFARPAVLGPDGSPLRGESFDAVQISAQAVSAELLRLLAREPTLLHQLTPRQFEEVMAELFAREGYDVTLTAATRDGGADLLVLDNRAIGSFLYVVECKKYRADCAVSVGLVRQLLGVVHATRATAGILATTSYFSGPARRLERDLRYQLALRDFAALCKWLRA